MKEIKHFMWQTAMAVPVKWTLCLLLLLPFQTVADDLKIFVIFLMNDTNLYNTQNTFFPPNQSSPAFVTVSYEYYQDNEMLTNETEIWYWSISTFYIYNPLPIFQFSSLLFSDISKLTSEVTFKLDLSCRNASTKYKRLLTQRVSLKPFLFALTE